MSLEALFVDSECRELCLDSGSTWVSRNQFKRDVAETAQRLENICPERGEQASVLVACSDRYSMFVACFAAWVRHQSVTLAPNLLPATLSAVQRAGSVVAALFDGDEVAGLEVPSVTVCTGDAVSGASRFDVATCKLPSGQLALSLYTSGTTGDCQRCDKTVGQLFGEARTLVRVLDISAKHTIGATVPAYHLYGLLFTLLVPWFAGARFVGPSLFQPAQIIRAVREWEITDLITVPTHLQALASEWDDRSESLRRVYCSGATLPVELARRFSQLSSGEVIDVLGSTESGGIGYRVANRDEYYVPLPGVEVREDANSRLLLRSQFLPDPSRWCAMSDRVRVHQGGFEYLGRDDGVVKVGAKRVAIQELEARARSLVGISDAAVLARRSPTLRATELWMAVVAERKWTPSELRRELARHFDPVVLPRRFRFVNELPRTAMGKIRRQELARLFEEESGGEPFQTLVLPQPVVTETDKASELSCELLLPIAWPFFDGHFPQLPIAPGVAQLSQIVLPLVVKAWPDLRRFTGALRIKYRRPLEPGVRVAVRVERQHGSEAVDFELRKGLEVAASGRLRFALDSAEPT